MVNIQETAASLRLPRFQAFPLLGQVALLPSECGPEGIRPAFGGFPGVFVTSLTPAPHTCWVDEALEDEDITINLVGGGEG